MTRAVGSNMQHLQQFRCHLSVCLGHAGDVAARPAQAGDKTDPDRVSRHSRRSELLWSLLSPRAPPE